MKQLDAYFLRRILTGEQLNGELQEVSSPFRRVAEHLNGLPVEARTVAWGGFLASRPDGETVTLAVAAVDLAGGPPEPERRRAPHLGDLAVSAAANRFVWSNWIVRGHFNLLSSDPKIGKTHVMLDLARRLWFGLPWPDGQERNFPPETPTLWVCGDRHQDELSERARAFGLPDVAVKLCAPLDTPYGGWDLDKDENVNLVRELIIAERPGLVFIDTVWRATRKQLRREEELNALLDPVITIAQDTDTAIVGAMHLSKDGETLGRRIEGLARAVMKLVRPDPEGQPNRRKLSVIGNFKEPPALGMTMGDGGCEYDFKPPTAPEPKRRGAAPEKLERCKQFLLDQLTPNPARVTDIRRAAAEAGAIPAEGSAATLYAAKDSLGVEQYELEQRKWWRLPASDVAVVGDVGDF